MYSICKVTEKHICSFHLSISCYFFSGFLKTCNEDIHFDMCTWKCFQQLHPVHRFLCRFWNFPESLMGLTCYTRWGSRMKLLEELQDPYLQQSMTILYLWLKLHFKKTTKKIQYWLGFASKSPHYFTYLLAFLQHYHSNCSEGPSVSILPIYGALYNCEL